MHLRLSDLYGSLLRPVGVRGSEFTFSDVRIRRMAPLKPAHSVGVVSDSVAIGLWYRPGFFFGGLSFGGSSFGGRVV